MPSGQDHAELPRAGEGLDSRLSSLHHWEIWDTYGKILAYMILYVTHMFHVYIYIYIYIYISRICPSMCIDIYIYILVPVYIYNP